MKITATNETQQFSHLETVSAKLLFAATLLALIFSNSSLNHCYSSFFHATFLHPHLNLLFIVNDGLMTIFFLVVGLEIKYEILKGSLNSLSKITLPAVGAMGGMLIPAAVYVAFNYHDTLALKGWAIPTATDIAFSLAILSFFGSRIPSALKTYLTALAIFDDVAAIIIIAFFYTSHIKTIFLGLSLVCLLILFILKKVKTKSSLPYFLIGVILWFCFLESGIHPTLAGIVMAAMMPIKNQKIKHTLHPWVALSILPLFAFANAGISFAQFNQSNLHLMMMLGVFLGLFVGKQIGIFGASWLAVKYRIATLPDKVRWREIYAVSVVCGIGFTISLFIATLAFGNYTDGYLNSVKVGVLSASMVSGIIGFLLLRLCRHPASRSR